MTEIDVQITVFVDYICPYFLCLLATCVHVTKYRKQMNDEPEKGRHGTTCTDNASDQIYKSSIKLINP